MEARREKRVEKSVSWSCRTFFPESTIQLFFPASNPHEGSTREKARGHRDMQPATRSLQPCSYEWFLHFFKQKIRCFMTHGNDRKRRCQLMNWVVWGHSCTHSLACYRWLLRPVLAELTSSDRGRVACLAENIYCWLFTRLEKRTCLIFKFVF